MRFFKMTLIAMTYFAALQVAAAEDCMYGCWNRPACGKVCKLVCETKALTAVGYGYKCETICIPAPSRQGCKHCYITCCNDGECGPCCDCPCGNDHGCTEEKPRIEFCWYDWFACGCAKPRTVKVLTKYQAEKEVCWYHWEVVDACECGCPIGCGEACDCVYKPAPEGAQIGDRIELTYDEREQLAPLVPAESHELATTLDETPVAHEPPGGEVSPTSASTLTPVEDTGESLIYRMADALRLAKETQ